jgi:hypothetical protein
MLANSRWDLTDRTCFRNLRFSVPSTCGYDHQLSDPAFKTRQQQQFLSHPNHPHRLWGPNSLLFKGYRHSSPGIKRTGFNADHSLLSNAEVKNEWSCASTPPSYLHGVHKGNFTLHVNNVHGMKHVLVQSNAF